MTYSRTGRARTLRGAFKTLHRWLGLGFGVFLVLLGLTGSLNVFYREIDAALNPALYSPAPVDPEHEAIGPQAAIEAAASVDSAPIASLYIPDATWPVWSASHSHSDGRIFTTTIDPGNGRVLGQRDATYAFSLFVYRLHYTLLLKAWWGEEFVGIVGIGLLILAITGLVAWWPALGRLTRSLFPRRGTSGQRLWLDIHQSLGFLVATILLVIAATGVGVIYPRLVRPIVNVVAVTSDPAAPTAPAPPPEAERLGADSILARARAARPGDTVTILNPPGGSRKVWRVLMRPADVDPAIRSLSQIFLDPVTGAIVAERSWDAMPNGDRYIALQLWLHNGSIAGLAGRILIFAVGLAPLVLFVTGFAVWADRRRRRRLLA